MGFPNIYCYIVPVSFQVYLIKQNPRFSNGKIFTHQILDMPGIWFHVGNGLGSQPFPTFPSLAFPYNSVPMVFTWCFVGILGIFFTHKYPPKKVASIGMGPMGGPRWDRGTSPALTPARVAPSNSHLHRFSSQVHHQRSPVESNKDIHWRMFFEGGSIKNYKEQR